MVLRRSTFYFIFLLFLAGVVCFVPSVKAAPPHFSLELKYPSSSLSAFPGFEVRYLASITPTEYIQLTRTFGRRTQDYDYEFDHSENAITYTRTIKQDLQLIPVTSSVDDFRNRRLDLSMAQKAFDVGRSSLVRDQRNKAGGLLQIRVPIRSKTFESIFGEGGAGLKVSGFRKITFSGRSSWNDGQTTAFNRQSKFPSLDMEQVYRFDITGTIGSKITVKVSQDSRNDIPLANRLILRYKGSEDDILQVVEAGNTTLNLPSTQFLKYSTRVQGLFGLKASAKIADFLITGIASQEKGNTETVEISAGSSSQSVSVIKDINYRRRTIFDLGRLPIDRSRADTIPEDPSSYDFFAGDSIIKAIMYLDDRQFSAIDRPSNPAAICYIDPLDTIEADPTGEYTAAGNFKQIDPEDYYVNPTQFYVQFTKSVVGDDDILGAYIIIRRGDNSIDTVGDLSAANDTLKLKLLKPTSHTKVNHHIWEYEWKNVYFLGGYQLDLNDLEVELYRGSPISNTKINEEDDVHQGGLNYLQVFGLDEFNESNQLVPDGKIDKNVNLIYPAQGLLIFRNRHPFDSKISYFTAENDSIVYLDEPVPEMYNTTNQNTISRSSRYYMAISSRSRGQSEIDLKAANIIKGSEVITYEGRRLIEGQDYSINYDFGTLTLLKDEYTDIGSDLSVMFETAPFFSLSKKTLLGTRMEYSPGRNLKTGMTVLYKSDKSTNRKPRVGEETSNMLVWDFDFSLRFESGLLTKMVSTLPFVTSEAKSFMSISGEVAQSHPNPNVDGQVYIDDFEGSKDSYSLGIRRNFWRHSSRPATVIDTLSERGRLAWYNPIEAYYSDQVWNRDEVGSEIVNILTMEYEPVDFIRTNNIEDNVIDSIPVTLDPELSWNGFMQNIPDGVVNQLVNVQLLEMRIKGDKGILHIDLGRISEDIDGDGAVDTEDEDGFHHLDEGEDVGLDGLPDSLEFGYDPPRVTDPAGDNFDLNNIWKINGTEGNGAKDTGDPDSDYSPDTEDPRPYNGLNRINSYFSYRVDLSDSTQFEVARNDFGWKTIRIALRDATALDTAINDPAWNLIEYARIWIDSAGSEFQGSPMKVEIASMELVSTTWGDSLYVADSLRGGPVGFDVSVINSETDKGIYTSPPGVEGYTDPTTQITEKEQSLLLAYENLNARVLVNSPDSGLMLAADTGLAVRKLFRTSNYMGYGKLEAFVHGPEDMALDDSVRFFFRIGYDQDAYYEYRTILKPGWHPENHVLIDFAEMTGLKARLIDSYRSGENDSSLVLVEGKYLVRIKRTLNDPSLTRIQYFSMGVINLNPEKTASGQVWVDELRLTDVRDDVGMAARISVGGNISDLITYNVNFSSQDAYYRGVGSSTKGGAANNLGSGQTRNNYSFSGTIKLEKFFPRSLEMSLPVTVNWSQSVSEPLLRSGTDIVVPEEFIDEETSLTITKGIKIRQSFKKKTNNILFSALLNRLSTSFSYNISEGHSPKSPMFIREKYSAAANYTLSIRKIPSIRPLAWARFFRAPFGLSETTLYLYPQKLTFKGSMSGSYTRSVNENGSNPTSTQRSFRGNMNMTYKIFDNLSGSYSFNTTRDLQDPETINLTINPKAFKLGVEQSYGQNFSANYSPQLFSWLTHKVSFSARYSDQFRIDRDSVFYHNATLGKTASLNMSLKHTALIGTNKASRGRGIKRADSSSFPVKVYRLSLKGIRFITDAIKPVSIKFGNTENLSFPKLADKASMGFRLGIDDSPGVERVQTTSAGNVIESKSVSKSVSAKSGVSLFSGIGSDVGYSRNTRESFSSSPTKTISETWPDLKFNLRSVRGLWYLGKLINKLNPSSGFVRSTDVRQRTNSPYPYEEKERTAFSPLISFNLTPFKTMRTNVRYETSNAETVKLNENNGEVSTIVKSTSQSFAFNLAYSFRSPKGIKLPFLGRLRFQSTLSMSVDVSFKKSMDESASAANDYVFKPTSERTNITIRPSGAYSFSNTVKGGISGRWQDSNDLRSKQKRHTRELSIWVEMRF